MPCVFIYFGVQCTRLGAQAIFKGGATIEGRFGFERIDPLVGIGVFAMGLCMIGFGLDWLFN